jgi:hypothetical protein
MKRILISVPCRNMSEIKFENLRVIEEWATSFGADLDFPTEKGYGFSVRKHWLERPGYDVYVHIDNDLAMPLAELGQLIILISVFGYDVSVGSRRSPYSTVTRTALRGAISNVFQKMCALVFRSYATEYFCGFRAYSGKFIREVMPLTRENHWMWQCEMTVAAVRLGYSIEEIPITWRELRYSRTPIKRQFQDARDVIPGIFRLLRRWH